MTLELKQFIQDNKDLINQNTKESWEEIYNNKLDNSTLKGEFTEIMLSADIDPAKILGYIPMYYLCGSNISNYKIPNNAAYIGYNAFSSCRSLASIEIPDSVTGIGDYTFSNCKSLANIVIPDSVTSISDYAFWNCNSLTSVVIGNSVTTIGYDAFRYCYNLTSLVIPDSVTSIGSYAFEDCSSLTSITIPDSVISISNYVFYNCRGLKEINFKGTKKQAIQLGIGNKLKKKWREKSSIQKIICTDGVIEL